MQNEIAKKRLEKAGHKLCIDIVVHPDIDHFSWEPAFVLEQLRYAELSREELALTLETIASALREA